MINLIIIALIVIIVLAIIGGGIWSFFGNVGKGVEKIGESGIGESVVEKGSELVEDVFNEPP